MKVIIIISGMLKLFYVCNEFQSNNLLSLFHRMLSKEILGNANFIQCVKEKTFKWVFENCDDWQFEIARNQDYLNQFTCFSLALQNYLKVTIKQTIAKILYLLEKFSATTTFFTIENEESEKKKDLADLWETIFMDNIIVNIDNLPEPKLSSYIMTCSVVNELEFPFSYYFMNQINYYKIYYDEELDILRQKLENVNEETKELHEQLFEDHVEDFVNNLLSVKKYFEHLQTYSE